MYSFVKLKLILSLTFHRDSSTMFYVFRPKPTYGYGPKSFHSSKLTRIFFFSNVLPVYIY